MQPSAVPASRASSAPVADYFGDAYDALYRGHLITPDQTAREARFLLEQLRPAPGEHWLDIPCGYGRHLAALQRLAPDLRLTGGDLKADYLRNPELAGTADLVRCDMRRLPWADAVFDAAINMLNSFGYFPPAGGRSRSGIADDRAVLAEWARVLRPGGRLVLDLPNRLAILRLVRAKPRIRYSVAQFDVLEQFAWEPADECISNRTLWRRPDGREERGYRMRLYTPAQIRALLGQAGFTIRRWFGDFARTRFETGRSERMLLVCRRSNCH